VAREHVGVGLHGASVRLPGSAARDNRPPFIAQEHTMSNDTIDTTGTPNPENRSDNLFPTENDDSGDDGRFEIAEEVSMDQQSDSSRKVGQVADDDAAEALAESIEEKTQTGI
jgi:hypothetical protein